MNVVNLKTFMLGKPISLVVDSAPNDYRLKTRCLYKPSSTILGPLYRPLLFNKTRIEINRKYVKARPSGIVVNLKLRERLGTIQLKSYKPITSRGYFISTFKEVKGMAKFRKRLVSWDAVESSDVTGYKLYWAVGGGVDYDSNFAEVGDVTEVILPDDLPSFPLITGDVEIGVTAVSKNGNESDITVFSAPFDFTAPPAPANLVVKDIEARTRKKGTFA